MTARERSGLAQGWQIGTTRRIANRRTRAAYGRAVGQFLAWCAARGLGLTAVAPLHVAAYIRTHPGSAPTVKQPLAALRMLGDWLVVSQVLPVNPAAAVRGPTHVVTKGAPRRELLSLSLRTGSGTRGVWPSTHKPFTGSENA